MAKIALTFLCLALISGFVTWGAHVTGRRESRLLRRAASAMGPGWAWLFLSSPLMPDEEMVGDRQFLGSLGTVMWYVILAAAAFIAAAFLYPVWTRL